MLTIAVVNHSTRMANTDVSLAAAACNTQARLHVAPAWRRQPMGVKFYPASSKVPPGAYVIGVFDDSDQAGALGWHTEGPHGEVYGKVFAAPVLDNGGTPLHGALTVASVLSHEVIEAFCDPAINLWAQYAESLFAVEACDPVEGDSYDITIGNNTVSVSNFVTPAWFDEQPAPGAKFDYLGKLVTPFTMTKGGYFVFQHAGKVQQKFGDEYPAWKRPLKAHPAARTARRMSP